jgi:hypothetical protein
VFERLGLGVGPREKLVDRAGAMAVDDPHDRVGEVGIGVDVVQLAGLDQRGDDRQLSAPPSEPAKSAFLRVRREA